MTLRFKLEFGLPESSSRKPNFIAADMLGAVAHDLNTRVDVSAAGTKLKIEGGTLLAQWRYEREALRKSTEPDTEEGLKLLVENRLAIGPAEVRTYRYPGARDELMEAEVIMKIRLTAVGVTKEEALRALFDEIKRINMET